MFTHEDIHGIVPPLITPLKYDGSFDGDSVPGLVDHVLGPENYVHGVFVAGTLGEFPWLDAGTKNSMLRGTVDAVNRRIPVLYGATGRDTRETQQFCEYGAENGADGLVIAPFYFYPRDDGLVEVMTKVAKAASGLPIYLYSYDLLAEIGANGVRGISPEMYRRLLDIENIWGIKVSSGIEKFPEYCSASQEKGAETFMGNERLVIEHPNRNQPNCVPSLAVIYPGLLRDLYDAVRSDDLESARRFQDIVIETGKSVYGPDVKAVGGIKHVLRLRNVISSARTAGPELDLNEIEGAYATAFVTNFHY